jgi:hypothetical protein
MLADTSRRSAQIKVRNDPVREIEEQAKPPLHHHFGPLLEAEYLVVAPGFFLSTRIAASSRRRHLR